jgi:gliding motility-associated-like protein
MVYDANNCSASTNTIVIANPEQITFKANQLPTQCGTTIQTVVITAQGGTGSLQYSIDGGSTFYSQNTFGSLAEGEITIRVKDANNCMSDPQTFFVKSEPSLTITANILSGNKCYGNNDAVVKFDVSGGEDPYYYSLNNGAISNKNIFTNVPAGNNTITVSDSDGCGTSLSFDIPQQSKIEISLVSQTDANCAGKNDGSIAISVNGGQEPYNYNWSNGAITSQITNLDAGNYELTVTDGNECTAEFSSPVVPGNAEEPIVINNIFTPNGDGINDFWVIKNLELYPDNELVVVNRWGNEVYSVNGYQNNWDGSQLSEGTYFYILKVNMCGEKKTFNGYITIVR